MTYSEQAAQVACESQIAVQVLLSRGNDDIELIPLRPHQCPYVTREDFTVRKLRSVGIVGLNGLQPLSIFKEPLESPVVNAIAQAFLEYVRVLISEHFAEHMAEAEIAELDRIWSLPDTRPN